MKQAIVLSSAFIFHSNPTEGSRSSNSKLEQQARNCALNMVTSIIQKTCGMLAIAREKADEVPSADILGNACVTTILLPLVMAHISPLATSDPRVFPLSSTRGFVLKNSFFRVRFKC